MYNDFFKKIDNLYKGNRKKLRTGTILYGNLYEDRWQTHIQKPLSMEELKNLENEIGELPIELKDLLLVTNGCYLFDLLRIAGKQDGYKGMSIEEQVNQPISFRDIVPYRKKLPSNLFFFADSIITDSLFAFNEQGQVIQLSNKKLKLLKTYNTLNDLLEDVYEEGERMVLNKDYIHFE